MTQLQLQLPQVQQHMITISLLLLLLLASNRGVVEAQGKKENNIDYKCNPVLDYRSSNKCATIDDGVCDNPNHGGSGGDDCKNQDCIDCNYHCGAFEADCYGCVNAKGCYYCAEDGSCQNSGEYVNNGKKNQICTSIKDYLSTENGNTPDECIAPDAYTQDPTYGGSQWMFEMINVIDVWEQYGLTGKGITVRINDDGVFTDNLEFTDRFDDVENSCSQYLPNLEDQDGHGTSVAGIILGNANNDLCSAGIAPEARFNSCNFFAPGGMTSKALSYKLETFDISQNSIGIPACLEKANNIFNQENIIYEKGCPFTFEDSKYEPCEACKGEFAETDRSLSTECGKAISDHCKYYYKEDSDACMDFPELIMGGDCDYDKLQQAEVNALEEGINIGRDGKGTIFTFASGNSHDEGDDVNFSGWTNSRYTITVGAVGKDGLHADYSTGGAALVVTAPAGSNKDVGHLMTAGLGVETCVDSGQGTSFACPVVSGVIALVLEANPELSWRDVQGVLAASSTRVFDDEDDTAAFNGADVWHSNWYGFGIINAKAAVEAAMKWDLYAEELQAIGMSKDENAVLTDNDNNEFVSTIKLNPNEDNYPDDFVAESVVVLLDLAHYNRGDLEIELESPDKSISLLHPGKRPEDNQLKPDQRWKLMTVRHWGENPTGDWKLRIRDLVDREETLDKNVFRDWKLIVYGRSASGQDGFGVAPNSDSDTTDSSNQSPFCLDNNARPLPPADHVGWWLRAELSINQGPDLEIITIDARILCDEEVSGMTNNNDVQTYSGPEEASRTGVCDCKAGLYDGNCNVMKEDLECECYNCPEGSKIGTAYNCDKEIVGGCYSFDCDGNCNAPFKFPFTKSPTKAPIEIVATKDPTKNPTKSPTRKPTQEPTRSPTRNPTREPTKSPTKAPKETIEETKEPTTEPTKAPTKEPTKPPTKEPTKAPTMEPTASPTVSINAVITADNSEDETPVPTESPTIEDAEGRDNDEEEIDEEPLPEIIDEEEIDEEPIPEILDTVDGENLSCETGTPINSELPSAEGTIRSFRLVGLEEPCLSGLETMGGWYQVIGNGNVFTLTACSLDDSKSVGISVFTGACSESECIGQESKQIAACENGNGHATSFASEPGVPYNVLVSGLPVGAPLPGSLLRSADISDKRRHLQSDLETDFRLTFIEAETPPNGRCDTAFPANFENAVVGNTLGLSLTYKTCQDSDDSVDSEKYGAWYTIAGGIPTEDGVIVYEANTCNSDTNFYNSMSVFRGDKCGTHACVDIDILPCPSGWFGQQVYWSTGKQENFQVFVHSSDTIEAEVYNAGSFKMDIKYNDRLANDQCTNAFDIELNRVGAAISTTSGAKPDMNSIEKSSCGAGGAGAWYKVTGTGAMFKASTCSDKTNHKTGIQIYSGDCGKLICIDSAGGNKALCDSGNGSVVNFKTQEDVEYFILVTGRREGKTGSFGLEIMETLSAENNECIAAVPLNSDDSFTSGSTKQATIDFPHGSNCVVPLESSGVWYEIQGTGKGVEVSTCQNNEFDSAISVFKGSCKFPECVTGSSAFDPKCADGQGVAASFYGETDTKYHVYVHGQAGSTNNMGDFNVAYNQFDILDANDFCPMALTIPTDGTRIQGSTEDTTRASVPSTSCGVPITNPGLWYTFQGSGQPFEITACSEDEGDFDVAVSVFEGGPGGCDSLTCLTGTSFANNVCGSAQGRRSLQQGLLSNFRFMTENKQDYFMFVHGTQGVGDFALTVQDENLPGFGTEAPTETPLRYGKHLHRWIPVNATSITIPTDYFDLDIVNPPIGNATIQGYIIKYLPPIGFTDYDVMTVDGCNDGECFRFDVTIDVMGKAVNPNAGGDEGFNLLWLLLPLLLLVLLCACIPFIIWYRNKNEDNADDDSNSFYSDNDGQSGFDDESYDEEDERGLLKNKRRGDNDSSVDDEDWESSGDEGSYDSRDGSSRSDGSSKSDGSSRSRDDDSSASRSENDSGMSKFSDEYNSQRRS